jgi:hypothetical protein
MLGALLFIFALFGSDIIFASSSRVNAGFESQLVTVSTHQLKPISYTPQSGDIILSRSLFLMTSIVTQITDPPSPFSHANIVIVGPNGIPFLIDVNPEDGLNLKKFNWNSFLKPRVTALVLRIKDPNKRKNFSKIVLELIQKCKACNIPDYFDFTFGSLAQNPDPKRFTCSELVMYGLIHSGIMPSSKASSYYSSLSRFKANIDKKDLLRLDLSNSVLTPTAFLKMPYLEPLISWEDASKKRAATLWDTAVLLELFSPSLLELDIRYSWDMALYLINNLIKRDNFSYSINFEKRSFLEKLIISQFVVKVRKRYQQIKHLNPDQLEGLTKTIRM